MTTQTNPAKNDHNTQEHADKLKREAAEMKAGPKLNAHDQKEHDDKIRRDAKK